MSHSTLKHLLKEYEKKRIRALSDLEIRKEELYRSCPRLQEIDFTLNQFAFHTVKSILTSSENNSCFDDFKAKVASLNLEKKAILKDLQLDDSFFIPHFECKKCEDTGYIKENSHYVLCSCMKQKLFDLDYNQTNITNLHSHTFNQFSLEVYSTEINEELYHSNLSPRDNIQNIKTLALSFIEHFDDFEEKNLLFTGNTGLRQNFFVRLYCL